MLCSKCNSQVLEGANFCPVCGTPFTTSNPASTPTEQWETCTIKYETVSHGFLRGRHHIFYAEATTPDGREYVVSKADEPCKSGIVSGEPDFADGQTKKIHNGFISKLIRDGWEPLDQRSGTRWFSVVLRRRYRQPS